jgi:hypothetical protein
MHVEKGKYYRDGNGRVIGPLMYTGDGGFLHLVAEVYVSDTPPAVQETEAEWRARLLAAGPGPFIEVHDRKTLRDEFAMAALKTMLGDSDYFELSPDQMAVKAYRQADAMMEARKK